MKIHYNIHYARPFKNLQTLFGTLKYEFNMISHGLKPRRAFSSTLDYFLGAFCDTLRNE